MLRLVAFVGPMAQKSMEREIQYSIDSEATSITAEVFKRGKPVKVADVKSEGGPSYLSPFEIAGSYCSVPLMAAGDAIGVLSVGRKQGEDPFTEDDAKAITQLGNEFVVEARLGPLCGDTQLVVEFEIPEGVSDEQFLHEVERVSLLADDVHRALGGGGLKVQQLEVYEESLIPEGVPNG